MKNKLLLFLIILLLSPTHICAQTNIKPHVLLLYSTENNEITNNIQILNITIGHFTNNITIKNTKDFTPKNSKSPYTHIVYIGEKKEVFSNETKQFLEHFSGSLLFLGQNTEQLPNRFSFITAKENQARINALEYPTLNLTNTTHEERLIENIYTTGEIIAYGLGEENNKYPFITENKQTYYVSTSQLFGWPSHYVGQMLFSYFGQAPSLTKTLTYIRLEDIHPAIDIKNLKAIANLLKQKKLPYMAAVIPVYKDPHTGQIVHLSEKPELLNVLRFIQDNGGSIILHGYTHQFYDSETGEGFEFWDVKTDQPIRHPNHEQSKNQNNFKSPTAFKEYIDKGKSFEKSYIKEHVEKGIKELTDNKLYPLAFEAPHYAISQKGYEILSSYFSTYIGHVQLSDKSWKAMHTPAFISEPSFLHGMKIIPETVGFIEANQPNSALNVKEKAQTFARLSDGVIGSFYHPYLGIKPFKELINNLESIPETKWLDLQKSNNEVKTNNIHITSNKDGINIKKTFSLLNTFDYLKKYGFFLILGAIGIVFLMLMRRAKRLES